MTYQSSPNDIMDAEFVANDATTLGAMVPYQKPTAAIEITPQQVYDLLPAENRDAETWGALKRASKADLERAYQHIVVNVTHNNYIEHHHHYEAPPTPPHPPQSPIQFVPMPYPVVEYRDAPQPVNIYNTVETSSQGGNAYAHSHSESASDGEYWGGPRGLACAFLVAACFVLVVSASGGE